MYTLEGVSSVAKFITAYEGLNKTDHLISSVFFVSKGNLFDVYFMMSFCSKLNDVVS